MPEIEVKESPDTLEDVVTNWEIENKITLLKEQKDNLLDNLEELLESRCPEGWPYCRVLRERENSHE